MARVLLLRWNWWMAWLGNYYFVGKQALGVFFVSFVGFYVFFCAVGF